MLRLLGTAAMALASRLKSGGLIVNEHTLSREQLRLHVDTLSRWFEFIHPDELPSRLGRRGRKPFCLLTFDDGHLSNATIAAPELARLGVPACFFVVTSFVGTESVLWFTLYNLLKSRLKTLPRGLSPRAVKELPHHILVPRLQQACRRAGLFPDLTDEHVTAMSWDQVRELRRRGFVVGAHGVTHAIMTRETREAAFESIERSMAEVSKAIGEPCTSFAFPNGNYTAELARHAVRCGARLVMTAEPTWADETFPLWRLPRIQLFHGQARGKMELKIALSASGRFLRSGDGTLLTYRLINRMAKERALKPAAKRWAPPSLESESW